MSEETLYVLHKYTSHICSADELEILALVTFIKQTNKQTERQKLRTVQYSEWQKLALHAFNSKHLSFERVWQTNESSSVQMNSPKWQIRTLSGIAFHYSQLKECSMESVLIQQTENSE